MENNTVKQMFTINAGSIISGKGSLYSQTFLQTEKNSKCAYLRVKGKFSTVRIRKCLYFKKSMFSSVIPLKKLQIKNGEIP